MARKKKHEEHVNAEAWAIPYGDLITLLLAFFVVMYSMSSVNEGKFRILSDSLIAAFRGAPATIAPVNIGANKPQGKGGDQKLDGVAPTTLIRLRDKKRAHADALPGGFRASLDASGTGDDKAGAGGGPGGGPGSALARMASEVRVAMQALIDDGDVRVRQTPLWLEVEIRTDILFGSGVARVSDGALPVLRQLADILKPFPNPVRVEGHTDNRPIRTAVFPSNWELSAARAANVVQLFTSSGLSPERLEVIGYGEFRPVAPNTTDTGRNRNRRVVVVVMEQQHAGDGAGRAASPEPGPVKPAAAATTAAVPGATPAASH